MRHAQGDADLIIVQTALQTAKNNSTVLIGEDTDLLVLALYHFKDEHDLFFTCEPKDSIVKPDVLYIGAAKHSLADVCEGLLMVHATQPLEYMALGKQLFCANTKTAKDLKS